MVKSLGEKRHYAGHACEGKVHYGALCGGVCVFVILANAGMTKRWGW